MSKTFIIAFLLGMAGCATSMAAPGNSDLIGSWTVEYIGERPVIDRSPAYMTFFEEGRVAGNSSCNQLAGTYELQAGSLEFSKIASTNRRCHPALMEQEARFLAALQRVAKAQFVKGLLVLLDANDEMLFRASRRLK
jgi:heat shock protein HslJ